MKSIFWNRIPIFPNWALSDGLGTVVPLGPAAGEVAFVDSACVQGTVSIAIGGFYDAVEVSLYDEPASGGQIGDHTYRLEVTLAMVTVSSNEESKAAIVDSCGDTTAWGSAAGDASPEVIVDLGDSYRLTEISVGIPPADGMTFDVYFGADFGEVSVDDVIWGKVAEGLAGVHGDQVVYGNELGSGAIRWVKVKFVGVMQTITFSDLRIEYTELEPWEIKGMAEEDLALRFDKLAVPDFSQESMILDFFKVKFKNNLDLRISNNHLVDHSNGAVRQYFPFVDQELSELNIWLDTQGVEISYTIFDSEAELEAHIYVRDRYEDEFNKEYGNLASFFTLHLVGNSSPQVAADAMAFLNGLELVEVVNYQVVPTGGDCSSLTDTYPLMENICFGSRIYNCDFETSDCSYFQNYLRNPRIGGLGNAQLWDIPGGRGENNVEILLLDAGYELTNHPEIDSSQINNYSGPWVMPGSGNIPQDMDHGVHTLSVLVSDHDGLGINGMVPNANITVLTPETQKHVTNISKNIRNFVLCGQDLNNSCNLIGTDGGVTIWEYLLTQIHSRPTIIFSSILQVFLFFESPQVFVPFDYTNSDLASLMDTASRCWDVSYIRIAGNSSADLSTIPGISDIGITVTANQTPFFGSDWKEQNSMYLNDEDCGVNKNELDFYNYNNTIIFKTLPMSVDLLNLEDFFSSWARFHRPVHANTGLFRCNFGSLIDCHAWGARRSVYCAQAKGNGSKWLDDRWQFAYDGTSAAGSLITGTISQMQSIYRYYKNEWLDPGYIENTVLRDYGNDYISINDDFGNPVDTGLNNTYQPDILKFCRQEIFGESPSIYYTTAYSTESDSLVCDEDRIRFYARQNWIDGFIARFEIHYLFYEVGELNQTEIVSYYNHECPYYDTTRDEYYIDIILNQNDFPPEFPTNKTIDFSKSISISAKAFDTFDNESDLINIIPFTFDPCDEPEPLLSPPIINDFLNPLDFTGDGLDDLIWYNSQNGDWNLFIQEANNTNFGTQQVTISNWGSTASNWYFIGSGDFNGDGLDDLAINNINGDIEIRLSNGISFDPPVTISGTKFHSNPGWNWGTDANENTKFIIGDMNGDSFSDIVLYNPPSLCICLYGDNGLLFSNTAYFPLKDYPWNDVTLEHMYHVSTYFNDDNISDLFISDKTGYLYIFINPFDTATKELITRYAPERFTTNGDWIWIPSGNVIDEIRLLGLPYLYDTGFEELLGLQYSLNQANILLELSSIPYIKSYSSFADDSKCILYSSTPILSFDTIFPIRTTSSLEGFVLFSEGDGQGMYIDNNWITSSRVEVCGSSDYFYFDWSVQ